jgi:hypothetical protein
VTFNHAAHNGLSSFLGANGGRAEYFPKFFSFEPGSQALSFSIAFQGEWSVCVVLAIDSGYGIRVTEKVEATVIHSFEVLTNFFIS